MVGRATLTTVPSSMAMLEPSTVARITQRPLGCLSLMAGGCCVLAGAVVMGGPPSPGASARQPPADDHPLDLVGSLDDLHRLRFPHEPLGREVLDVSVAAEHLHRVGGHPHGRVAGE